MFRIRFAHLDSAMRIVSDPDLEVAPTEPEAEERGARDVPHPAGNTPGPVPDERRVNEAPIE